VVYYFFLNNFKLDQSSKLWYVMECDLILISMAYSKLVSSDFHLDGLITFGEKIFPHFWVQRNLYFSRKGFEKVYSRRSGLLEIIQNSYGRVWTVTTAPISIDSEVWQLPSRPVKRYPQHLTPLLPTQWETNYLSLFSLGINLFRITLNRVQ
jgi:hypothetical protein